jgi:hypothetical protein
VAVDEEIFEHSSALCNSSRSDAEKTIRDQQIKRTALLNKENVNPVSAKRNKKLKEWKSGIGLFSVLTTCICLLTSQALLLSLSFH